MSLFKVPKGVLKNLESLRCKFFHGAEGSDRKMSWFSWDKVLVSKQKGGLGVSSLFALNRALLFKWVWRFISKDSSLWSRCIQAFHGIRGSLDGPRKRSRKSLWLDIIKEVKVLKNQGIDLMAYCSKRVETCKNISVADKLRLDSIDSSFCRMPKGGNGEFYVKSVRNLIDDSLLSSNLPPTRWVKEIPIKINVFAWKVQKDNLPTHFNLSRVGIDIQSIVCPICETGVETVDHLLFSCSMAREVLVKLKRWWNISSPDYESYNEWFVWFSGLHLRKERKKVLEGVFYVMWWKIWNFRNQTIFGSRTPRRAIIFDDIVADSFSWCSNRCNFKLNWISWLKDPNLAFL
ncbi:RNA-directed DNA polymerase, eukaryota, reverse transcriptase zinc-binding domain protein [Tanacetum coccineum]